MAEREFRLLITARLVSQLGNQAATTVTGLAVLTFGDATDVGLVLAAESLALAAFLVVGGVLGDRHPRRRLMMAADLVRFASQGLTAALVVFGCARLWQVVALQVVSGAAAGVYLPAVTAIGAEASSAEYRGAANALRSLVNAVTAILGPALGGLLAVAVGPGQALVVDAGTFAVSAAVVSALRVGRRPGGDRQHVVAQVRAGWREFRSRRWLWTVTTLAALCGMLVFAPLMVLGPVIALSTPGGAGAWASVLSALGVGAVAGGILITRRTPRRPLVWVVSGALLLLPLPLLLAVGAPLPALWCGALAMGVEQSAYWTLWQTTLQQRIPTDLLSRVSSFDWLGYYAVGPLGYLLTPLGVSAFGVTATLLGGVVVVSTVVCALLLLPEVRADQPRPGRLRRGVR